MEDEIIWLGGVVISSLVSVVVYLYRGIEKRQALTEKALKESNDTVIELKTQIGKFEGQVAGHTMARNEWRKEMSLLAEKVLFELSELEKDISFKDNGEDGNN